MSRDVGLDLIVAKMIADEYMAGLEELEKAIEFAAHAKRGVIVKGLLRTYASAARRGDMDEVERTRAALEYVPVAKALEIFNFASGGQQEREVVRDKKGRFSRYLANAGPTSESVPLRPSGRKKGQMGVRSTEYQLDLQNRMQSTPVPGSPGYESQREQQSQAQMEAGKIRAISRFQDELMQVFGPDSKDIVVVVENEELAEGVPPQELEMALDEGVSQQAAQLATKPGTKMTLGMRPSASQKTRDKFQTLNALIDAGMRPDVAASYLDENPKTMGGQHRQIQNALLEYTGAKKNTYADKAKRHFETADRLGSYFVSSGSPQLQTLGAALKGAGRIGQSLDPKTFEFAERMNYRLRGMKDNLPREYSNMTQTPDYQVLQQAFGNPNLDQQMWNRKIRPWLSERARTERALSTDTRSGQVQFTDPVAAVLSHMDRTVSQRVSPRDFVDRFTRDIAVTSLVREVPADERIVELGAAAGYGVPSSGIIIRSDGQAKEMYRGVADDHYLPFSIKALPELRDGQYVRTRTIGGFTPEDITTSVVSGARKATLVSSSGVFTLELKPDTSLVGRMRSPEVAAMGEKYERILNQVSSSGLYARDLPADEKALLYEKAREYNNDTGSEGFKSRLKQLTNQARSEKMKVTDTEIAQITEDVKKVIEEKRLGGSSMQAKARLTDDMVQEAIDEAKQEKVRALTLNAEGYALALETLQAQYPSIIRRVGHESLKDFVNDREMGGVFDRGEVEVRNRRGRVDRSLVEPGQTRAYVKDWAEGRGQVVKPGHEKKAETTATTEAGAGGTGGTGGTGPSVQDIRGQATRREIDKTITDAVAANPFRGKLQVDPTAVKEGVATSFSTPEHFASALPPGELGINVPIPAEQRVGLIVGNDRMMEAATKSQAGLTAVMSLAYGASNPADTGWDRVFMDSDAEPDDLAAETDRQASAFLLRHADVRAAPVGTKELAFFVPKDVIGTIPKTIEQGKIGEVAAKTRTMAYDTAIQNADSTQRKAAMDNVDAYVRASPIVQERFLHSQPLSANSVEDLSILGLMGVQAHINNEIDKIDFDQVKGPEAQALLLPMDNTIADDKAGFENKKKKIKATYQSMFGTEYLLRTMGGGGVGPKALGQKPVEFGKAVEPSQQDQLELLLELVRLNPETPEVSKGQPLRLLTRL